MRTVRLTVVLSTMENLVKTYSDGMTEEDDKAFNRQWDVVPPKNVYDVRNDETSDIVLTPDAIAADVVRHFRPTGRMLDPCRGSGAFWNHMPGAEWCEAREGRDFFAWYEKVDWIVSNPPYSIFAEWMEHSLKIADNIVYLIPLAKVFSAEKRIRDIYAVGGIVETRLYGAGTALGFPFGWPCGAVHIRVGYKGPMEWSFYIPNV